MNGEITRLLLTALLLPTALPAQATGGRTTAARVGGNSTLVEPRPRTPEEEERRRTPVVQAVEKAAPSVINVYVQIGDEPRNIPFAPQASFMNEGAGSGVVIDGSGLAITNWHVVDSAIEDSGEQRKDHRVMIKLIDGAEYEAGVVSSDASHDLALLQIRLPEGQTLPAVELGNSDDLLLGETLIAIGNPLGRASTITRGILSAVDQEVRVRSMDGLVRRYRGLLQTDTPINPGNSGGALIDINGNLVGINNAKSRLADGIGFAIPVSTVRSVFRDKLVSPEGTRGAFVGLNVEDADGRVIVVTVERDSPGERAGVEVGDRLVSVDGTPIGNSIDWIGKMMAANPDRELLLVILRDGEQLELKARPLANAAYGVVRMTGIELEQVPLADAEHVIRAAYLALERHITGVPTAEPSEYPASTLRVLHVRSGTSGADADIRPGDLLVGMETVAKGMRFSTITKYDSLDQIHDSFVELTGTGPVSGECLLWRDGRIIPRPLKILKPR